MAGKKTSISVNITGDARDAIKAINQTTGEIMTMQQKTTTAISGMANAIGSSAVVAKIGDIAKTAIDAAANLEQSIGGVDVVFKNNADQIHAWAASAAQNLGLSQNSYNELATIIGSQLKNAGMSMDQVAGKTNDLITLGADLSSMFGGSTTQAVEALSSALKGEMDPIEAYGVSLNDATLQAQAASMGIGDLYAAGDRNAKMQATLAAITAQTSDATGNFAREAGTAQGQQQRLNATWENAQAALGQALLPAVTWFTQKLTEMASWVQQNSSWLTPLAVVLGVVAAAVIGVNAAMSAYAAVAAIVAVAQGALNLAFLPVIAVIAAVIAVIALLVMNWDSVKAAGAAAAEWIANAWSNAVSWLQGAWSGIVAFFSGIWNGIQAGASALVNVVGNFFQSAASAVQGAWNGITGFFSGIWNGIQAGASALVGAVGGFFQSAASAAKGAWNGITGFFSGIWNGITSGASALVGRITAPFQSAAQGIKNAFSGVVSFVQGVWDTISGIFSSIGNAASAAWDTITGILPFSRSMTPAVAMPAAAPRITVGDPDMQGASNGRSTGITRLTRLLNRQATTTGVTNNITYNVTLPARIAVGDKRELIRWIKQGLAEAQRQVN